MSAVRVLWAPHPFRAGFCITDDTDAATLESVRLVYDFLASIGLKASKTVWAFTPAEPCGIPPLPDSMLRGVTLEDRNYAAYCDGLAARGFEICLHGASAGNNRRERTERALALVAERFGRPGTYICHSKNAENLYWHEKVAPRGPAQALLKLASRYRCSGADPSSPYFWGDLCLEHVAHIRLFRTRNVNTLADNPSMPYHDPEKPFVRSWFGATKRSLADCTSDAALARLRAEHGLCVLYQYLHRYADLANHRVAPRFQADAERLMAAGDIWVETTSRIMDRLRLVHGVFIAHRGDRLWLLNAGTDEVRDLQLAVPGGVSLEAAAGDGVAAGGGAPAPPVAVRTSGGILHVPALAAGAMLALRAPVRVRVEGERVIALDGALRGHSRLECGSIAVNAGTTPWVRRDSTLVPGAFAGTLDPRFRRVGSFSCASLAERYRLLGGQLAIIGREIVFKGRALDSKKFLDAETIPLEDHANW